MIQMAEKDSITLQASLGQLQEVAFKVEEEPGEFAFT